MFCAHREYFLVQIIARVNAMQMHATFTNTAALGTAAVVPWPLFVRRQIQVAVFTPLVRIATAKMNVLGQPG